MVIGALALQGDYEKHLQTLHRLEVDAIEVRNEQQARSVDGLILPGGESTTIGKLLNRSGLDEVIRELGREGLPLFGTCAGLILLATDIEGSDQHRLGLLEVEVRRNAFGRQIASFEADISFQPLPDPVKGVFIRAPWVNKAGKGVQILSRYEQHIVAVQQGSILGTAFHPELTSDTRVHEYFIQLCQKRKSGNSTG